jgi:hypothetical protein
MSTTRYNGKIIARDDMALVASSSALNCIGCVFRAAPDATGPSQDCLTHACFSHTLPDAHPLRNKTGLIWIKRTY